MLSGELGRDFDTPDNVSEVALEITNPGTAELTHRLRLLLIFLEDTPGWLTTIYNSSSRGSDALFGRLLAPGTHSYTENNIPRKNKITKLLQRSKSENLQ